MSKKLGFLDIVSAELNLDNTAQDWGIENAAPARIKEFIEYFNTHKFSNVVKYELFDLIVASFNDAILEGLINKENE